MENIKLLPEFQAFQKIARLSREVIISEKIDGTNGQIVIGDDGEFLVGSRSRWITPENDNHGFAQWAWEHREELLSLGPGRHFGEWWGCGIQRGYGLQEKRFSLFNTIRWAENPTRPLCCHVVPVLYQGMFETASVYACLMELIEQGSHAAPGFLRPEGVVIYHKAANMMFKKTIEKDEAHKGEAQ